MAWLTRPAEPPPTAPKPVELDTGGPAADDDIEQALAVTNPGYVGIDVCAECHAQRAAVVKGGRHYLACRPAATGVASPGFAAGRGQFATRVPGLRFEMTRAGNDFVATRIEATPQGEKRVPYQVGLVYGTANKHDEVYFAWQGDRLYELPVAWLYPLDRWGTHNHNQAREAPANCMECHNTWIAHVPGTANQYHREGVLLGVTCERCHGPGRDHTEYHRKHPNDASRAILHPGTLSRERLMDLCAQCHDNPRPRGRAFAYRPGEPLETTHHVVRPTHPEDDVTNQVRYLEESKCYQKSEMTCITCHDPHRLKSARGKCLECHAATACTDQPRLPAATRGDCVGCHMPQRVRMHAHFYSTSDDQYVPVTPRSDHRIGVYPEARRAVLLAWLRRQPDAQSRAEADRLAAQLTQHWVGEGDKLHRASRFNAAMAAYREALLVSPDPVVRQKLQDVIARHGELEDLYLAARKHAGSRPAEAIPFYKKMLDIRSDLSFVHGELGNAYAVTGQREEAVAHLQSVAKFNSTDAHGAIGLAWMAYLDGRLGEAAAHCATAQGIDPTNPAIPHIWGMVLAKQDRWADAEKQFRKTLLTNPADAQSNRLLSESLRRQGQATEAIRFARRAARWGEPQNIDILLTLADAYAAASRTEEARTTLGQALTIAERTNLALVPAIHDRLRALP